MERLGHTIVIGGSIAGLIAARVLSDHFEHVTVLERDEVEDRPVLHKSVPQGNHLHALLNGGQQVLSALYPGFTDDLASLGANRVAVGRDVVWYLPDGKAYTATGSVREPFDVGLEGYCASRGLIEYVIRRRSQEVPHIQVGTGKTVRELISRNGRISGVRCDDGQSVEADLVVDASGRASPAARWLAAAGLSEPRKTTIGVDTAYSTAKFRVPDWYDGESIVFITGPAPTFTRRCYLIRIENGSLLVSLIGRFGDYPPTDREGFLAFAKELHSDLAWRILKDGEQLSPVAHHRFPASVQNHYEELSSLERFIAIGDALCTFNPIHAQGMSAAARQASLLGEVLSQHLSREHRLDGLTGAFYSRAAELNSTPWNLAAGFDFAFPQTRGDRPAGAEERARYFAILDRLQAVDPEIRRLMTEVFHLVKPLSLLLEEPLRSRVRAHM
ncbi:MAG: NAD(P)/FAD-dependent oxidoreductase, partial [Candidatus Binataceae bacterium]